jgi:hypothetical protein
LGVCHSQPHGVPITDMVIDVLQ